MIASDWQNVVKFTRFIFKEGETINKHISDNFANFLYWTSNQREIEHSKDTRRAIQEYSKSTWALEWHSKENQSI